MNDEDIIEEILLIGDYFEGVDEILSRNTQKFKGQRIIELDLSNLDLDELSPTVVELDQLKVLNLENNELTYLPPELGALENLEQLYVLGNPLEAIPKLPKRIRVDVTLPEQSDEEMKERRKIRSNVRFPDKKCFWCNKGSGYRKEVLRTGSKWGFTSHVSIVMVCLNCSYMHQFYSGRSLYDFD